VAQLKETAGHRGLRQIEATTAQWEALWASRFSAIFTGLSPSLEAPIKPKAAKAHVKSLKDLHNFFSDAVTYYIDGLIGADPI
jgi:hypothetical protein